MIPSALPDGASSAVERNARVRFWEERTGAGIFSNVLRRVFIELIWNLYGDGRRLHRTRSSPYLYLSHFKPALQLFLFGFGQNCCFMKRFPIFSLKAPADFRNLSEALLATRGDGFIIAVHYLLANPWRPGC